MTEEQKITIKKKIESRISRVKEDIKELVDLTQPIAPENSLGRISRMDAINNKSVLEAALRKSEEKLAMLKTAFQKLEEPDFGQCTSCKNPINLKRLMLMPESAKCISCAKRN